MGKYESGEMRRLSGFDGFCGGSVDQDGAGHFHAQDFVIPAEAGIQIDFRHKAKWIPAYAGMTQ